jgi:hypothetical protein
MAQPLILGTLTYQELTEPKCLLLDLLQLMLKWSQCAQGLIKPSLTLMLPTIAERLQAPDTSQGDHAGSPA